MYHSSTLAIPPIPGPSQAVPATARARSGIPPAWLGNFRRLVVRYDRRLDMYRAFFHLAWALVTLRFLEK